MELFKKSVANIRLCFLGRKIGSEYELMVERNVERDPLLEKMMKHGVTTSDFPLHGSGLRSTNFQGHLQGILKNDSWLLSIWLTRRNLSRSLASQSL